MHGFSCEEVLCDLEEGTNKQKKVKGIFFLRQIKYAILNSLELQYYLITVHFLSRKTAMVNFKTLMILHGCHAILAMLLESHNFMYSEKKLSRKKKNLLFHFSSYLSLSN